MTQFVLILWSCAIGDPFCTHPDATWSGQSYHMDLAFDPRIHGFERDDFNRANPTRQVIKFEVMTKERWFFEKGSYHCGRSGE